MPLQIVRQDITKMCVDAIVNTTNEKMVGLSGVDFAVHKKAGPELDKECAKLAPLGLGEAKVTKGYNLDAKYIIHTSGPVWSGGLNGESAILKSCYLESLKLAVEKRCESVAFPLISSGAYGYPKDSVLKFAIDVIAEFLLEHEIMVYICVFDRQSYEFSRELFNDISEFIRDEYIVRPTEKTNEIQMTKMVGFEEPDEFIDDEYVEKCSESFKRLQMPRSAMCDREDFLSKCENSPAPCSEQMYAATCKSMADESLDDYIKNMDKSFAFKLFDLIDERGMTDVECYKKANVDKKTFSKIKCNPNKYRPSKQTAVAFAIALKLDIKETQDLLASAGLTLSESFVFDKIIRYFIQKEIYDIFEINEALFEFDQMLLGC